MKSQKTKITGLMVAVLLMFAGSNIQAQNDGPPAHRKAQGNQEMNQREMRGKQLENEQRGPRIPNLSEEQEVQLKAIHLKSKKAALPLKNLIGEKEARLKTLTTSEDFNVKATNNIIDEIGSLKSDLHKLRVASSQEIKTILTEEQLVAFNNHQGQGHNPHGPKQGRER